MPATQTKSMTAHIAMPFKWAMTGGIENKLVIIGKTAPNTPGPSRMPPMIWTTTSGA